MSNEYFGNTLMGLSLGIIIFSFIISLITIVSYWKIFSKAGKPGWASIVPIYNTIVMLEIAKLPLWYIALFFVPIVNIYVVFKIYIEIAKKFGKSSGFGIGMALLGVIFIPLLAFSDLNYEEKTNNENNSTENISNTQNQEQESVAPNIVPEVQAQEPVAPTIVPEVQVQEPVAPTIAPEVQAQEPVAPTIAPEVQVQEPVAPTIALEVQVQELVAPTIVPEVEVQESVVQNAFDSVPIINNETETLDNSIQNINAESIIQNLTQDINNKKKCKNCGNDLPEIVSICPSCGTDNE